MNDKQLPREESEDPELSYFELQAYVGTTKHMGGFEATKALIELCPINKDTYVLDAGCGVGATACHLAKRYDCRVVGVDISESMIARSHERAKRERVEDSVEFRVADVRNLPFDDALFDVVICESVATFIEDRGQVASEFVRVTKPGGYVGLNEEIWLKAPPTELVEFAKRTWEIKAQVPTAEGWVGLLEDVGLRNIIVKTYKFNALRESSQLRRYSFQDLFKMFYRTLYLYIKSSAFRRYMRDRKYAPKNLFEYLGYAIFVGRK
jgi:ubiquinone/menaquinone biosynthesis C-methylase UbiE